jgi:hypothetical protein
VVKRQKIASLIVSGALPLAGCSALPRHVVTMSGVLPTEGSYRLLDEEHLPPQLAATVIGRLEHHGLRRGQDPTYFIQFAFAQRPPKSGVIVPGQSQWLAAPERRGGKQRVAQFTLSITDSANGREVYHALAQGRRAEPTELVEAVLSDGSSP